MSSSNNDAMVGGPSSLTFKTKKVEIDPGHYSGTWYVLNATDGMKSAHTVSLVPDLGYIVQVGTAKGRVEVSIDANGDITSENQVAIVGGPSSLTFKTTEVNIDPTTYSEHWNFLYVTGEI